jgi:hypothetical protein
LVEKNGQKKSPFSTPNRLPIFEASLNCDGKASPGTNVTVLRNWARNLARNLAIFYSKYCYLAQKYNIIEFLRQTPIFRLQLAKTGENRR